MSHKYSNFKAEPDVRVIALHCNLVENCIVVTGKKLTLSQTLNVVWSMKCNVCNVICRRFCSKYTPFCIMISASNKKAILLVGYMYSLLSGK